MSDNSKGKACNQRFSLSEFEEWLQESVAGNKALDNLEFAVSQVRSGMRVFRESIRTLSKWLPVIVGDRQWDHYYLFRLLDYKLALMEECMRSGHAMAENSEKTAGRIHEARLALRGASDEGYCWASEWYEVHHKSDPDLMRNAIEFAEQFQLRNLKRFTDLFYNHVTEWWD